MTDRITSDFAALFTPPPSRGVQFSQARVLTWDNETLANTLEWRGITIRDVPLVEGINALTIRPGDIVGILGWAPENAKGVGSWWILGKLSVPGEFVADLNVTAKIFRFVTENGHSLAFFGKEADGDPLWALYYGGADEQWVMRTLDANDLVISYRDGVDWLRISGTAGEQIFQIRDNAGHELISSDGASDVGLARPYFNYHISPAPGGTTPGFGSIFAPETDSTSYVVIHEGINVAWHPVVAYSVGTTGTGGGTPEFRIRCNGTVVGSFSGITVATDTFTIPGWGTSVLPGHEITIDVQARNTGAGNAKAWVRKLYGRQS